jgi:hypothetical protein
MVCQFTWSPCFVAQVRAKPGISYGGGYLIARAGTRDPAP